MKYICPVCGYPGGGGSYEICPSCWFQFGVSDDDEGYDYEKWREEWIKEGMPWRSTTDKIPKNWNPKEQLKNLSSKKASTKRVYKQKVSIIFILILGLIVWILSKGPPFLPRFLALGVIVFEAFKIVIPLMILVYIFKYITKKK